MVPTSILFVCLGNICRSPAAHAVVEHHIARRSLDAEITVDSAGTGSWHVGERPHRQSAKEGNRRGYSVDHIVRQVHPADFDRFDLVIGMDHANRRDLIDLARSNSRHAAQRRIRLLREFDPLGGRDVELDDPWGQPDRAFIEMYDIIERCVDPLLEHLTSERS